MPKLCLFFPKHFEDPYWAKSSFSLSCPDDENDHRGIGEWVVGRHPAADITCAIQSISKRHCCINYSYANDLWFVTDLGSSNGTRINGQLIPPHDPHPLKVGDILHLGPNAINVFENEQSTENMSIPTTISGLTPLDYRTGEPLEAPPPAPAEQSPPSAEPPPAPAKPNPQAVTSAPTTKTWADTLHLATSWLISPSTALGMMYRLIVLGVAATVVVLVMGAI